MSWPEAVATCAIIIDTANKWIAELEKERDHFRSLAQSERSVAENDRVLADQRIAELEAKLACMAKWEDYKLCGWELMSLAEVGDKDRYRCTSCGKIEWFLEYYTPCSCREANDERSS